MGIADLTRKMLGKNRPAYDKLDEARVQMVKARNLRDFVMSASWPDIKESILAQARAMQEDQNKLSANPQWNADEIIHLNANRSARVELIAAIEEGAAKYEEWKDRVDELEAFIQVAEATQRKIG